MFQGIFYFLTHRQLWRPLAAKLLPSLTLGAGITAFMFVFTYVPQAAVMAFTQGPLAAVSAAVLVLSESSALFTFFSKSFLIEDALLDTFDGTMLAKGASTDLVSQGRTGVGKAGDVMNRLGKLAKRPFAKYTPTAFIRYLLYLPLNFIPVVGTVLFFILQGRRAGPAFHARYFQLKGMSASQREEFIQARKGAYTSLGMVGTLLEMVPVVGVFFAFTNMVGAAMWAADLETKKGTSSALREQAKDL